MPDNILDAMSEHYQSLTNAGKKLAKYILSNRNHVQYLSITSLAENSHVSEATITRFCKELGTSGYNDFKLALAKINGVSIIGTVDENNESISSDENLKSMCQKLFATNVTALKETLELQEDKNTEKAVACLQKASKVYCFGQGGSNVMAEEAWARFSTVTPKFIHIHDSHMQAMAASLSTPDDVILYFSYSGSTKDMADCLSTAKKRGSKILLVTHFANSPASAYADVILQCGSKESPLQSGSVAAKISQLFIIDYLFYGYCQKSPDFCLTSLEATAEAIAAKLL